MEQYGSIIAAFINSVLVLGIVQIAKVKIPILKEKIPWLIPIIAGAIGPAVAAGQNYLSGLLGVGVDLNPIAAIFTGATAVAIHQIGKQAGKAAAVVLLTIAIALSFTGCANLSTQWKNASEEDRVKIILDQLQTGIDASLFAGEVYVMAHPEKKAEWQTRVLPIFKIVNDLIGENIKLAKTTQGKITVAGVLLTIQPKITEIETILLQWGAKK